MSFDDLMYRDEMSAHLMNQYRRLVEGWQRRASVSRERHHEDSLEYQRDMFSLATYNGIYAAVKMYDSGEISDIRELAWYVDDLRGHALENVQKQVKSPYVRKRVAFEVRAIIAEGVEMILRAGECDE